jgi:PAS domain S-box-containing protein
MERDWEDGPGIATAAGLLLLLVGAALALRLSEASLLPITYAMALLLPAATQPRWQPPLLTAVALLLLAALAVAALPGLPLAALGTALIALAGGYRWLRQAPGRADGAGGLPALLLSPAGQMLGANSALRQLLQWRGDGRGPGWWHQLHPEDRSTVLTRISHALQEPDTAPILGRLLVPEQGERWYRFILEPASAAAGGGARRVVLLDVDASERTLSATCRHRDQLLAVLSGLEEGCVLLDADWQLLYANAAAERLLRFRPAVGTTAIWQIVEGFGSGLIERQLRQAARDGVREGFVLRYGPTERYLRFRLDAEGSGWRLYVQDRHDDHARDSQLRLLDTALQRINDYVVITEASLSDQQGPRIVYANAATLRKTGYRAEELIGRPTDIFVGPETRQDALGEVVRQLRSHQAVRSEVAAYTRHGERFWVEMDWAPLVDEGGWETHWVGVLRDITEHRQLEPQRRLAQHMETLGQLTRGVAHDFNNLLTVILGNGDLLSARLQKDAQAQALVATILAAAERGAELMQRLLALARRQALTPSRIDPLPFVDSLLPLLRATLRDHIELHLESGPVSGAIFVDPAQLESAIVNLALIARDAMPQGGRLCLRLRDENLAAPLAAHHETLAPGHYVVLELQDNGPSLSPHEIQALFEPFTGGRQPRGHELRFAAVHGFLRQSDGHVVVRSAPGEGRTVRLYLPRLRPAAAAATQTRGAPPPAVGPAAILIVEDDPLLREFAAGHLQSLGHRVQTAESGSAALALIESGAPVDLLFTDILMPGGINGPELVAAARALRPSLRVLYTSGYADSGTRIAPGEPLLPKPYRGETLSAAVAQALH